MSFTGMPVDERFPVTKVLPVGDDFYTTSEAVGVKRILLLRWCSAGARF
jgi:hypothetical protein